MRLFEPITVKELSGSARRWQTFAARTLYVALVGVIVWEFTTTWTRRGNWLSLSDYARMGRDLFEGFFALQSVMVAVSSVAAAADMITRETRAGTLGLLASTPLTPGRIAWGKWQAAVAQTATLILCGAPISAICVFLGGATPRDLVIVLILTIAAAGVSAAVALYLSTRFRSGVTATLVALAILAAYTFGPIPFIQSVRGNWPITLLCHLHPVYAAVVTMAPTGIAGYQELAWFSASAFSAVAVTLLLVATARRVALLAVRTPTPPALDRAFEAMDRFYEGLGPEKIRAVRIFGRGDGVWQSHALLWKELRTRSSGRLRNSIRISVALLALAAVTLWWGLEAICYLVWGASLVYLVTALSNGVGLFVKEKEERKWDVLLSTPLTSGEILGSKLLAGLVPLAPPAILLLLFWASGVWVGGFSLVRGLQTLVALLLPGVLAYLVGAVASLRASSLRGAFTVAFGTMAGVLAVGPFAVGVVRNVAYYSRTERTWVYLACSPFPYLEQFQRTVWRWFDDQEPLDLTAFASFVALFGGAAVLLAIHVYRTFDRVTGRIAR